MSAELSSREFSKFQKFIEEKCGIYLGQEKSYLIESRLSRILIDSGLSNYEDLYKKIYFTKNVEIIEKVIDAITTNETLWFRDRTPWRVLEDKYMPKFVEQLRDRKKTKIRIWSAACSTGQEPYSISMCIDNYLSVNKIDDITLNNFEILATDISHTVLQSAKLGTYDSISIARGLDEYYRKRYFTSEGRMWQLHPRIVNSVRYEHFNLLKTFDLLDKFDMVFCRYVIIYFSDSLKSEILNKIAHVLRPEGVLFIGSSELLSNYRSMFELTQHESGVYYTAKR